MSIEDAMPEPSNSPVNGSLEHRVVQFLSALPGAENIDHLPLTIDQSKAKKADFFIDNRRVICELKSLQSDVKGKIDALMEPLTGGPQAPAFYGEWEIEKILRIAPDGEKIRRKIFENATSSVLRLFRKANEQIATTRSGFDLPHASGVLVLINDLVPLLSPEILMQRIAELIAKIEIDGRSTFEEIEAVWVLSETHEYDIGEGRKAVLSMVIVRNENSKGSSTLGQLQKAWAAANGMRYQEMAAEMLGILPSNETRDPNPVPRSPLPLHERVSLAYRARPYLRHHSTPQLKDYFSKLFPAIAASMAKGASPDQRQHLHFLMELFTHFLEEIRERGIDMNEFKLPQRQEADPSKWEFDLGGVVSAAKPRPTFERGRFYVNSRGGHFKCMEVAADRARLQRLELKAGKLEAAMLTLPLASAVEYWPVVDPDKLEIFKKRQELWDQDH